MIMAECYAQVPAYVHAVRRANKARPWAAAPEAPAAPAGLCRMGGPGRDDPRLRAGVRRARPQRPESGIARRWVLLGNAT